MFKTFLNLLKNKVATSILIGANAFVFASGIYLNDKDLLILSALSLSIILLSIEINNRL